MFFREPPFQIKILAKSENNFVIDFLRITEILGINCSYHHSKFLTKKCTIKKIQGWVAL